MTFTLKSDSGAQYMDGTIDTTRTVHFGSGVDRPTLEMCEAYTRVLQGHIAIDSAVFPIGTSGRQLDVLARNALWKDGLNYLVSIFPAISIWSVFWVLVLTTRYYSTAQAMVLDPS